MILKTIQNAFGSWLTGVSFEGQSRLHWFSPCGAYQRNKAHRRGLLDEMGIPDQQHVLQMTAANERVTKKINQMFKD